MRIRYGLLSVILTVLIAQLGMAQRDGGIMPPDHMGMKFVSQPPPFARVDVPYIYTAKAVSRDSNAVIHYFSDPFMVAPAGFSIDSVTGVVTWTPKTQGWYPISIIARSDKGEIGVQRFTVTVSSGNGIIQGKVVADQTQQGIPGVVIEVLQARDITPTNFGCFSIATRTDMNGNYRLAYIPPGKYLLHAVSPTPQYLSQWYDGKMRPDSANQVTVADSPSVTIANFVLHGGPTPPPPVTVQGTVQDTTGAPIKGAEVFFVRSGFALNTNSTVEDFRRMFDLDGHMLDFRMDGHSPHVFRTVTDSLGQYTLKAGPGLYVAFARAGSYAVSFYLNKSDFLTADRLMLSGDTTGIDFTLRKLPGVALGTIQGSVLDTAKGIGVRSRIIAFRDRWTAVNFYNTHHSYTVDTDTLGAYTLDNLLPGSYIVLALPMGSYCPAFYASDTASSVWRRATRVLINGNSVTGIDIYVHEIPPLAHGFTGIMGTVQVASGPVSAVAGTIVYARWNSSVMGFGIADASGDYEIAGLAPGTYTVTADLPGFDAAASQTAKASYSSTGMPQFATVNLNLSVATDVEEQGTTVPETFVLSQNYPNPFNPSTSISYQLPAAVNVDLRVYDVIGREVAVLASGVQTAGEHTVKFDASSLSTGVYFYRLSAGTAVATMKMLLLK
jgi:protocatechuate 3,4-dioxygenase beta subunit